MHNLLIGKNILVRSNISNPALYHQFQNPITISITIPVKYCVCSFTSGVLRYYSQKMIFKNTYKHCRNYVFPLVKCILWHM